MIDADRSSIPATNRSRTLVASVALLLLLSMAAVVQTPEPAAAAVPAGFTEVTAFSGLVNPTAVRFAPDGRIFVAEKRGTIQMYDGIGDTSPVQVADLRTEVHNFWDRGLLGLAVDPDFPARPYLYALYTFDGSIGGTAPQWGSAGVDSDPCPDPPGATRDGCIVSSKLVKLTLTGNTTTKQDLIHDWCQQYPSHTTGDVVFGDDGALYVSGGEGAGWAFADYGQGGSNPVNPCGDPGGGAGGVMSPPAAEGGALRAQDLRTPADPVSLDGTVIRVSPDTGAAMTGNPDAEADDPNAQRIVAYGLRNPFRMAVRPGTGELWLGDVGWTTDEEVNRLPDPADALTNFGWPCFEGPAAQGSYDAANLSICENLYASGGDTKPFFSYRHGQPLNPSDNCADAAGSSISGVSFYSGGSYPPEYDGALFFADYARNCIWVMTEGGDGLPAAGSVTPFVSPATAPVDLEMSPAGELFYADVNGGTIRRIVYEGTPPPMTAQPAGDAVTDPAPRPVIDTPVDGTTWKVGDVLTFSGSATDPQEGALPASALSWEMVLQHCPSACHAHPLQQWTGVSGASIAAPDHEYPAHLELRLTATDSDGTAASVIRRLDPRTVPITVDSQPHGLALTLGAGTGATPFTTTLIDGSTTSLSAPSPVTLSGTSYEFLGWSDGGGQSHDITAGAAAATYTATYTATGTPTSPPTGAHAVRIEDIERSAPVSVRGTW
jgi:glucose/arabinose dehydrogenase